MNPEQIQSLAAELTEADIAAIILAKAPEKICGVKVSNVTIDSHNSEESGRFHTVYVHAGITTCANGKTIALAAAELARRIGSAEQLAAMKRADASRLLAEAEALDASLAEADVQEGSAA